MLVKGPQRQGAPSVLRGPLPSLGVRYLTVAENLVGAVVALGLWSSLIPGIAAHGAPPAFTCTGLPPSTWPVPARRDPPFWMVAWVSPAVYVGCSS